MGASSNVADLREFIEWLEEKGYRVLRARVGEADFEAGGDNKPPREMQPEPTAGTEGAKA